jgi:protein-S-isoprenylcysteine O-methyltransferase Ste14
MIFIFNILIFSSILSFSKYALFLFNKNVNLSSLPFIFSQTFTVLIWINIFQVIIYNDISAINIKVGAVLQIIILILFWSHIKNTGRTSIETDDDVKITIPQYGLFKYIRHPIFTIYMTSYFGIFWLYRDWVGIILSLFLSLTYVAIGRNRDHQMSESELAEDYERYMSKTGVVLPSPLYFFK